MPSGVYCRKSAKPNPGLYKKGKKSPPWLVKKRVAGIRRTRRMQKLMEAHG